MKYCDLRPAVEAYAAGRNVTAVLRGLLGEAGNTSEIIEIAYDIQAGSYIEAVRDKPEHWHSYTSEIAAIISGHLSVEDKVLEVGTGEMTTLTGVANAAFAGVAAHYAMDISWSRIRQGRAFVSRSMRPEIAAKLNDFVADLFHLPFGDKALDVIWTSHALEPNGGRERAALMEFFRVARKRVILFEPSYENTSEAGRARMELLGYVRNIPQVVADLGGRLEAVIPIKTVANPLNPTHAYVLTPPATGHAAASNVEWACPATGLPMERLEAASGAPGRVSPIRSSKGSPF